VRAKTSWLRTNNTMATRKKEKRTNNDLQNTIQKAEECATPTPLNLGISWVLHKGKYAEFLLH